jgi:glycosyltransferase involved in cell wall biosynthesis
MRVLIVSGIWPPDVGGPASHGPDFGRYLIKRGFAVRAITTSDAPGIRHEDSFPVEALPRTPPVGERHVYAARAITRAALRNDIVYATGMYARSAIASWVSSTPLIVKLANDPAFERARARGLFNGDVDAFQHVAGDARMRLLRALRSATLARATTIITPSAYLANMAEAWAIGGTCVKVIPNPTSAPSLPDRSTLRKRFGFDGPTAVFAGRLVVQKNLQLAIDAIARIPGMRLVLVGGGPEQATLEGSVRAAGVADRIRFEPPVPRAEAMAWMKAADIVLLSSAWENFPHSAVEALSVGTPVVATNVGGVAEIIEDGVNGALAAPGSPEALAAALCRTIEEAGRSDMIRKRAHASSRTFDRSKVFAALEQTLLEGRAHPHQTRPLGSASRLRSPLVRARVGRAGR